MCRYMWTGLCDQVMCNLCYTEVDSTWVKGASLGTNLWPCLPDGPLSPDDKANIVLS